MTYKDIQEFTKQVVLKYLPEIVRAEECNKPVQSEVPELSQIAYGLPLMAGAIYLSILSETYNIQIRL